MNIFPALQLRVYAVSLFIESHRHDFLTEAKHCAQLSQLKAQTLDDFPISEVQQDWSLVKRLIFTPSVANMDHIQGR